MAKKRRSDRWSVAIIVAIVTVILCIIGVRIKDLSGKLNDKRNELEMINKEIETAEEKTDDIRTELKYRETDNYIEDEARDLGLRYPDEIILRPEEDGE